MSKVSIDDIFKIKSVSSPKAVPQSDRVTYLVTATDEDKDTYYSYLHNFDGRGTIQLTYKNETITNVSHSHDGALTLFTAPDDDKKPQVFILRHAGGEYSARSFQTTGIRCFITFPLRKIKKKVMTKTIKIKNLKRQSLPA